MDPAKTSEIKSQLIDRKNRLNESINKIGEDSNLLSLLKEVDAALERMDNGSFGICEVCHQEIEEDRLQIDPLIRVCLSDLSTSQQRIIEQDINLASKMQNYLLPQNGLIHAGWEINYHYEPAGPVSGDYCDVMKLSDNDNSLLIILGDVSGKGIAASMLMMHLHAMFHSLLEFNLPVDDLVSRVNRLLCESTMSTHYSTLVLCKAGSNGIIEICNAGHCQPILINRDKVKLIEATGLPIGLFCSGEYTLTKLEMEPGDILILYTDGLSEAMKDEEEYGTKRILDIASRSYGKEAKDIINNLLEDLRKFTVSSSLADDLTLMTIKRLQ